MLLIKVIIRIVLFPLFIPMLFVAGVLDIATGWAFDLAIKFMDAWSLD